jgi:hypothetical protein
VTITRKTYSNATIGYTQDDEEGNLMLILEDQHGHQMEYTMTPGEACKFAGRMLNRADRKTRRNLLQELQEVPFSERGTFLVNKQSKGELTESQAVRVALWSKGDAYRRHCRD